MAEFSRGSWASGVCLSVAIVLAGALVLACLALGVLAFLDLRRRGHRFAPAFTATAIAVCLVAALTTLVRAGLDLGGATAAFFVVVLVVLAAVDVAWRIVPNSIVLTATPVVLVGNLVADPSIAWPAAGALLFTAFLLAALLSPSGLGMGDVKLAALIGVGCGSSTLLAVVAGCVLLLSYSAVVFARVGVAAGRKRTFPFVPFLAAGAIVAVLVA